MLSYLEKRLFGSHEGVLSMCCHGYKKGVNVMERPSRAEGVVSDIAGEHGRVRPVCVYPQVYYRLDVVARLPAVALKALVSNSIPMPFSTRFPLC